MEKKKIVLGPSIKTTLTCTPRCHEHQTEDEYINIKYYFGCNPVPSMTKLVQCRS